MIDLEKLLRLRLVVARFGEFDNARWWNTKGQLGKLGAAALRRGFPRTYHFAQARSVFAVAAQRCDDVFNSPGSVDMITGSRFFTRSTMSRVDAPPDFRIDSTTERRPSCRTTFV